MAEGIITLKKSGSGSMAGRISWSSVPNGMLENTSTITAKLQVRKTNSATTSGTWKGSFTVGGTKASISVFDSIGSSWVTLKTIKVTVSHNADGTGSCYIYGKIKGPTETSVEGTSVAGSETVTLDQIDRYATIVSIPNITDEENLVVNYDNPMGEALLGLKVGVFYESENLIAYKDASTTENTYTVNLDSVRKTIRQKAHAKNSITLRVILRSVIRPVGNNIYETYDATAEVLVSIVNAEPVVSWTIVDTNSKTVQLTKDSSILVALHSLASISIQATAKKEASIKSIKVVHGDQTLDGNGTLDVVDAPIVLTVVDSRGNSVELKAPNTIIPYFNPTVVVENTLMNAEGELPLVSTGTVYVGALGAATNAPVVKYRYKQGYGAYGNWIAFNKVDISGYDFDASSKVVNLDYTKKYTFQVVVFDLLHPEGVVSAEKVFVSIPSFYWNDEEFHFNVPVNLKDGCDIQKNGKKAYAPAGYGLAEVPKFIDDLNTCLDNGWYAFSDGCANRPENLTHGSVFVLKRDSSRATQLLFGINYTGNPQMIRYTTDAGATWIEDWVNPRMITDTEYRTTERLLGKAVYKKADSNGNVSYRVEGESAWYPEKMGMKLLWANANPTSTFDAHKVSVDLSKYQMVAIEYRFNTTDDYRKMYFGNVGSTMALDVVSTSGYLGWRSAAVSTTGISFSTATYNKNSGVVGYIIPVAIYGIKGVTA